MQGFSLMIFWVSGNEVIMIVHDEKSVSPKVRFPRAAEG